MIYTLHDDTSDIDINFVGRIIGQARTGAMDALRWTEVRIYLTQRDNWVVEKVGRTTVYHEYHNGCRSESGNAFGVEITAQDLEDEDQPCPVCKPPYDPRTNDYKLRREVDRQSVHVCDKPEGVLESLLSKDDDGVMFLSKTASRALTQAKRADERLTGTVIGV